MKKCAAMVLASLFVVPTVRAAEVESSTGGAYGVYYFKQWKAMTLDTTRIAVQGKEDAAVRGALAAAGMDPRAAQQHTMPGWWMVTVPQGAAVEAVVSTLAAQAGVEFAAPVFVGQYGPNWPTRDLMIGFDESVSVAQRDALLNAAKLLQDGGKLLDRDWDNMKGVDHLTSPSKNGFDVIIQANTLAELPVAKFAEPDMVISGTHDYVPNDPFFGQEWGINNFAQSGGVNDMDMNGPEAWDITLGSPSIIVAILDSGVDLTHPDLNLGPSHADFTGQGTGGAPFNSCDNHGTAVAGCISGRINNSIGGMGIAPGCRVASARPFIPTSDCSGWTSQASWTVNAVNWAQTIGARVTNNSNGYGFTSSTIDTAYTNTYNAGIVHFASAGNNGTTTIGYPASIPAVQAVAAIDRTGTIASFSDRGAGLDFAAPGVTILSTDRQGSAGYVTGDYVNVNGTSFASPYSAGVAALILSRNPAYSAAQVVVNMQLTAKDRGAAGYDTTYGYGIPNAYAALLLALPRPANDFCSGAIDVSNGGTFAGNLTNATFATADGGGTCGSATTGADVWYTFTAPPVGGVLHVTTCGTHDTGGVDAGMDTVVSIFDGCGGAQLGCNDDNNVCGALDAGNLRDSSLDQALAPSQTVKIRVAKYGGGAGGNFTLNIGFTQTNDSCSTPIQIPAFSGSGYHTSGTLSGATNDGVGSCGSSAGNPDVWYRFTACNAGQLRVTTCGSHDHGGQDLGMDTVLSLHATCGIAASACNDDAGTGPCGTADAGIIRDSVVTQNLNGGETTLIRVSKFGAVTPGYYALNVFFTPANDTCAGAVAVGAGATPFCNVGAATDGPTETAGCVNSQYMQNDVWFRYVAGAAGPTSVSLCDSNYDTEVAVYGGSCPSGPGSLLACNDDSTNCGLHSFVTFNAVQGQAYLLRVGSFSTAFGSGTMVITPPGGCGTADFNGDGDIGTDQDIEAFFRCLAGNCCPTCFSGGADFNGDGDIGTDQDIESFFRVLAGGNC